MPKSPAVHAFSAGGVIYRHVAIALAAPAHGSVAGDGSAISPASPTSPTSQAPSATTLSHTSAFEVALVGSLATDFWVLPKGTPKPDETHEQVALREVEEETGIQGRIVGKLGSIHYTFSRKGVRFNKEVLYYLMEAVGGDVSLHDHEYEDAHWFNLDEAATHLAYANEANLLRKAITRLTTPHTPRPRKKAPSRVH